MKNKVIDLFGRKTIVQNEGIKYSELLDDFIKPYENDFPDDMDIEEVVEFSMHAWNMGNLSMIVPKDEFKRILAPGKMKGIDGAMLKKMIGLKRKKFAKYDRFIADVVLEEVGNELKLVVTTQSKEAFLEDLIDESMGYQPNEENFEEGYINRYAIVLKPNQPFFDWINSIYPDDPVTEVDEVNIYLVEETDADLQGWLRKKFDRFFIAELDEWHTNKKEWPQKRSYKMFKEWFSIEISTMIYDFEKKPVYKED